MRKIHASTFVSLDGVMQAPGGPAEDPTGGFALGGWTFPHFDDSVGAWMDREFSGPFDLLLGRRTYEIFAAHWANDTESPVGTALNRAHKYVASQTLTNPTWDETTVLSGDVMVQIAQLKTEDGPPFNIQGSGNLIQSLLTAGLIDEFRVLTFPVLLGKGKRLFGEGTIPVSLELTEHEVSDSGVIMARYQRSGPVRTGSFAAEEPSDLEKERRRTLGEA